ncbi:PDZ domain-containing protein [Actinosynnema sp. NPDC047251]|uniref:Tricorn protease homolog n=1 Tax=Saccharothrix espanaensis (strain ATCC 51144 / DSM 44229 / JCM 9112 / NBRC 15066 / NRRL 15764) TaxID=1179773 RepID=K0JQT3_SACES|nr:S41 family peptidase [Saccharothrix espanaensis]CCH28056.1 Tricorn protease 1 like protein [Saccharothrix espanaensis DSM 44229]
MTDAYLRYPHLHGDLVTFVAEDDVWLAPLAGGRAWRVSADRAPASTPRFDRSGTLLAWASRRDGAPEVHVAPVAGGEATRLTHWGNATTGVRDWTPDGEVVAVTAAGEATRVRRWAHAVPTDGGPPRRLPYGWVGDVAHGPAHEVVVTSMYGKDPAYWKHYRGGSAGRLWVDATGDREFTRILPELTSSLHSPMWIGAAADGGRIAFLSDHDGVGSVYSCLPDGSDLRRHTEQEFFARAATTDGSRIVYQHAGDLWVLDSLEAEPRRLDVVLGGPRTATRPRPVSSRPDDFHPDRTGRASVVEVRGTVHWVTHRDGPARSLAETPGVRARLPRVVGDGVVWVTDAEGEEGLEFAPAGGVEAGNAPRRVAVGKLGRVLELAVAPDGRRLAAATHDGRLLLVEVESGEVREVLREANPHVSDLAFSPDSNWLAWSHPGPGPLRHIRMTNTTDLSLVDVTPLRFADYSPTFSEDGRYLAFLSLRTFDPVYDAHVFDLSFPTGCRPFLLPLAATTPSPFDPLRLGRSVGDDDKDKEKDKDDENPITVVDLDGLADRVVPVPVAAAGYSGLTAAKGGLLWLRSPLRGVLGDNLATPSARPPRAVLERFDLAKVRVEVLVDGVDAYEVTGDGQRIVLQDGGDLRVVPADRKVDAEDSDSVDVDLSRIRVVVDRAAEWRQAYGEAGRLMRDLFWRADMGGVDWPGVLDRYRPLVDRLGAYSDLVDLLWEVQGELGTSHAYVVPAGGHSGHSVGLLGADLARDESGAWRVERVIPGETSDPDARSPLAAPGVAVRAGDAIVAVDGRPVDPVRGPGPLLVGTAGKPVELTVRPGGGGEPRRVVVVPLEDDEPLRYHAWVADRRARTHELSDGRVGYLHVPDMMGNGWAQLHRDLRVELAREAVVLDVRENGGGHTSQLVVEKLARKIIGWQVARGFSTYESYPQDAPRGPVVAIADEFAGSDGDIVNVAIKEMGIGPVVGTRTWGGVIGIDFQFDLVDGTVVTQPRYALWFAQHGWGVENHGVDPDVEVVMTPQDRVAGRDPQLETAVRMALESLAERTAFTPPLIPPLR